MVCERFFARDFTPRQNFRDPGDSTVPEAWPVTYDQMRPWYAEAEKLLGVRGQPDPLRPEAAEVGLPAAPPFSADNQPLVDYLAGRGLHPYHLPMACDYTDGCTTCQTYLCHQSCKNDAARNGVLPAIAKHGARLLTECRVVRLDADRTQVRQVICEHRSGMLALKAKVVVLAAGALATPVLLLNSRSGDWPRGLANGSDWVGRNLMRHLLDPIEIWPQPGHKTAAANKEIGLNDFYFWEGQKYGTVQSFGAIPPMEWLTNRPGGRGRALRLMSPAVRRIYERFFTGGLVLAAMLEDLPYLDNRVLPSDRPGLDGRQRLRMQYRLHASEIERRAEFLRQLKEVFKPFRKIHAGEWQRQREPGPRLRHLPLRYRSQNQRAGPAKPGARSGQPLRGGHLVLPVQRRSEPQFDGRSQRLAGGRARGSDAVRHLRVEGSLIWICLCGNPVRSERRPSYSFTAGNSAASPGSPLSNECSATAVWSPICPSTGGASSRDHSRWAQPPLRWQNSSVPE